MRNISFSMTTPQIRARTKTITRRLGWDNVKPGTILQGVVKGMGLKKGEKIEKLAVIRVVSNTREQLSAIHDHPGDCAREGFPEMMPDQFIAFFCAAHHGKRVTAKTLVNRIEFEYV